MNPADKDTELLRSKLTDILFKAAGGVSDMAKDEVDQIMSLISHHTQKARVEGLKKGYDYIHLNSKNQAILYIQRELAELNKSEDAQLSPTKNQTLGMKIETEDKVPDNAVRFDHVDGRSEGFIFDDTKDPTNKEEE